MLSGDRQATLRDPAHRPGAGAIMTAGPRRLARLASGRRQGPITRLITPWDLGERTTPFVLLNYAEAPRRSPRLFNIHPPTGITTLTAVLSGELSFEDTTARRGEVATAGCVWMKAGSVIWHEGGNTPREPLRAFHLWIAQPGAQEEYTAASEYIAPDEVEEDRSVRVLLGELGRARSRIRQAPADLNFFHVRLKDRQDFRYAAPDGHDVTWLAVDRGSLQLQEGERVLWEQIAVFEASGGVIEVQADGETSFVLGTARSRPQGHPSPR